DFINFYSFLNYFILKYDFIFDNYYYYKEKIAF
ncbi:hypothetical protein cco14_04244, partial [Campylobacter coli 80352]